MEARLPTDLEATLLAFLEDGEAHEVPECIVHPGVVLSCYNAGWVIPIGFLLWQIIPLGSNALVQWKELYDK